MQLLLLPQVPDIAEIEGHNSINKGRELLMKINHSETDVDATEMPILPMKHHWLSCGWENTETSELGITYQVR